MFQTKCNLCHKPVSFFICILLTMLKHEKHVCTKKRNANDNNPVFPLVLRLQLPYNVNQKLLECLSMHRINNKQAVCNIQ